jgi:hypothetical protein
VIAGAGARSEEFAESRRRAGLHERTFLQSTPMGDLVIVTLEGKDPAASFGQMMSAKDAFTTWFIERASAASSRFGRLRGRSLASATPGSS